MNDGLAYDRVLIANSREEVVSSGTADPTHLDIFQLCDVLGKSGGGSVASEFRDTG